MSQKKTIIAIVLAGLLVLLIIGLSSIRNGNSKKINLDSGVYFDKNSGEAVSNPRGKGPDHYESPNGQPVYLGISKLLNYGISDDQLSIIKNGFLSFSNQPGNKFKEISVTVASIKSVPTNPGSQDGSFTLTFGVIMDRKTHYSAKVLYSGISSAELFLYDQKGTQVFDSAPPTVTGD